MKKLIFGIILGIVLIFPLAKDVRADCVNKGFFGCDSTHTNSCGDGNICCFTPGECGQYPAGSNPSSNKTSADVMCGADGNGIDTAIGCVPVLNDDGGTSLMGFILKWAIGVGGGIAFLLIIYAGFMIMTAAGNPERLKAGQELMTSAISGLVLLIFSIFVLKFIGLDILGLGAFGFGK